jgi:hypothetical protein
VLKFYLSLSLATEVFRIAQENKVEAVKYLYRDNQADILLDLRESKLIVDSLTGDQNWALQKKGDRLYVEFEIVPPVLK